MDSEKSASLKEARDRRRNEVKRRRRAEETQEERAERLTKRRESDAARRARLASSNDESTAPNSDDECCSSSASLKAARLARRAETLKKRRAEETEEERTERLDKRRKRDIVRRARSQTVDGVDQRKTAFTNRLSESESATREHAAQKFRTMKTKYKDLKRMHEVARAHGRSVTRPRWRYYELMDDFMRGRDETPRHSSGPVMVISNIYSVAEQSPVVAAAESEAPIVPELRARAIFHPAWRERHLTHTQEQATCSKRHFQCQACALVLCRRYFLRVHHIFLGRYENTRGVREATRWPSEQSVSDGPEKKKIKQEPHYDEDVSWDTNDSVDDRVDGESLSSNQAQAQQHRAEATLENTADTSMASTSASPTAGSQQDAFHFFGMMVADRLRRLPRGAALRALNAMHQVLFEHEEEAGF
ncbi:uncharacterized protein LOC142588008 isoform X2 [Dermacentor variabilis]|uniref:uncharacterized protein LOC142588008 isoform X2 n=1 Tax=Dermacentor variabilis TaxID=34621 RepID=UPI003F5C57CF